MPSTPTTKSQVQAYRFVLRRMESALVRKDPVMLHDPMRSHKRSTIVGVIVGVVGLVGFLLFGVLDPAPTVPSSGIVIAQPSGSIYVVSQNPHELIPVFNLASARLLLAAAQQQQQQSNGSDSGSNNNTSGAAPQVVNPTTVDDDQLTGMPMGRLTGIPAGPTVLPKAGQAATTWAVCDDIPRDPNALNETGHNAPSTTVIAGVQNVGPNLPAGQALLVSDDNGQTEYLVYGLSGTSDHQNDGAVRALVDTSNPAVTSALGINKTQYRVVSAAVLNAIPSVPEIQDPTASLDKTQPVDPALQGAGLQMGESFSVQQLGQGQRYYIVVPGGMQQVSETTAQIARFANSGGRNVIPAVRPDAVDSVHTVPNGLPVNVGDYPGALPSVISADQKPAMCLAWQANYSDPQKPIAQTRVTVDFGLDLPVDPTTHQQMRPVQIGQATSSGKVTSFFMNPQLGGAAIRAATSANEFSSGPIFVIDPRGVKFSVPDTQTAQILGVADGSATGDVPPAPQSIVGLLPSGGSPLSIQAVQKTFDSMPVPDNVGQFITPANNNNGGN